MDIKQDAIAAIGNTPLIRLEAGLGRDRLRNPGQGRVHEPRPVGQGPRRAFHRQGRHRARTAAAGRSDRRRNRRQHRHRPRRRRQRDGFSHRDRHSRDPERGEEGCAAPARRPIDRGEPNKPYAELWIGAHPKAPSEIEIDGTRIPLNKVIEDYPTECLGEYVRQKFSGTFPFLLKILSAAHALSIQTHPNKVQAQQLHAKDPKNYPDDNHKPEIAIALDALVALVGFQPVYSIKKHLEYLPELDELVGQGLVDEIVKSEEPLMLENLIKQLYRLIMQRADDEECMAACIAKIRKRLTEKEFRSPEELQFLEQYELYGTDVGLFSFFFFNLVHVQHGQAIFTGAGVPHAYIKGNIIECMANSDNVVRAGLTKKFKDVETLLNIIQYDFAECPVLHAEAGTDEVTYRTAARSLKFARTRNREVSERSVFRMTGRLCVWSCTDHWKYPGMAMKQNTR